MYGRKMEMTAPGQTTRELTIRQCRHSEGRDLVERHTQRGFFGPNIPDLLLSHQIKAGAQVKEVLASSGSVRK